MVTYLNTNNAAVRGSTSDNQGQARHDDERINESLANCGALELMKAHLHMWPDGGPCGFSKGFSYSFHSLAVQPVIKSVTVSLQVLREGFCCLST